MITKLTRKPTVVNVRFAVHTTLLLFQFVGSVTSSADYFKAPAV